MLVADATRNFGEYPASFELAAGLVASTFPVTMFGLTKPMFIDFNDTRFQKGRYIVEVFPIKRRVHFATAAFIQGLDSIANWLGIPKDQLYKRVNF